MNSISSPNTEETADAESLFTLNTLDIPLFFQCLFKLPSIGDLKMEITVLDLSKWQNSSFISHVHKKRFLLLVPRAILWNCIFIAKAIYTMRSEKWLFCFRTALSVTEVVTLSGNTRIQHNSYVVFGVFSRQNKIFMIYLKFLLNI
jgi:hypothetical protein